MVIKKRSEPMGVIKYAVSSKPARLKILQSYKQAGSLPKADFWMLHKTFNRDFL